MFKRVIKTKISHDYFSHNVAWLGLASVRKRLDELNPYSVHVSCCYCCCCLPMFLDLLKDLLHLSNRLPAYSARSTTPHYHVTPPVMATNTIFRYTLFSHQFFHYLCCYYYLFARVYNHLPKSLGHKFYA